MCENHQFYDVLTLINFYDRLQVGGSSRRDTSALDAKSPEVQGIAKHMRDTISHMKNGTWRHYGKHWQGGRTKNILYPGHKDARDEWLAPGPVETMYMSREWTEKEWGKALDRIKRLFFRDDMEPFHNQYRDLWNLPRVPAECWKEEEKIVKDMPEEFEHDAGEEDEVDVFGYLDSDSEQEFKQTEDVDSSSEDDEFRS